jgi:single-strand DNA-binding protein
MSMAVTWISFSYLKGVTVMSNHFVSITGYLGQDPSMRYLPNGTPVTNFSVATTFKWTDSDSGKHEQTTWFRVSAWGRQGEVVNEYLHKGDLVQVVGRLNPNEFGSPRIWTTKDGETRASYEVTAQRVDFLRTNSGERNEDVQPEAGNDDEMPF